MIKFETRYLISCRIKDLISDFLYYDRKGDEELPVGAIEQSINDGNITIDSIVELFRFELEKNLK